MPSKNGKPIVTKRKYSCIVCGKIVARHGKSKKCKACLVHEQRTLMDERIFDAIVQHKIENDGLSPTISTITKRAFVCKQTVKDAMARLVAAGRVNLVHRHFYVGMIVTGGKWTFEEPSE